MPASLPGPYPVQRIVDGDTLWIERDGARVKLRLIGIDTPETSDPRLDTVECFGEEATQHATATLAGRSVYLETDPTQDSIDRYGRELAYVWTDDGRLFNLDMIYDGYGHEYTYDLPYRYQTQFRAAQADAEAAQRGLWSPQACPQQ